MNPLRNDLSRRDFVRRLAKSSLGVAVGGGAGAHFSALNGRAETISGNAATADHCIVLMMTGGMSHLDTFDPKPGKTEVMGATETIKTAITGEPFAANLPLLAKQANRLTVIRNMFQVTADHRQATYTARTSYSMRPTIVHPSMGPWAQRLLGKKNESLPDSVTIAGGSEHPGRGFMPPEFSPVPVGDPNKGVEWMSPFGYDWSEEKAKEYDGILSRRLDLTEKLDAGFRETVPHEDVQAYTQFYDETLKFLRSEDLKVFDLDEEQAAVRDRYGRTRFGQGCLLAKRLVSSGVRFVEVTQGGWDTHTENFEDVPDLAGTLDRGASMLLQDLAAEGLLERTLVVIATEFGRTPTINANRGRDHHSIAYSCAMAGGGVPGGQIVGKSDAKGERLESEPYEPKHLNATIARALGMDLNAVVYSASGRPFTVATHTQKGADIITDAEPIKEIFS